MAISFGDSSPRAASLNVPWGITKAADHFGPFADDILIGNAGDGKINVYDPTTGNFLDPAQDSREQYLRQWWPSGHGIS